ncbi:Rho termination factor N-terminal domain-containing protein [Paenibacillus pinihumi]|uniref:Rho termination factor N-terminal domain-containing protein n=1 Tax=Paenibacillus pinihumi TaxID=669462 RepID=UPI000415C1B2|nr:Rho termination factor N-terminal domain-containing protein [Paenibacillus pinihumi]
MNMDVKRKEITLDEKFFARLWSGIGSSISLEEGLSRLTKNELDELRRALAVKNASGLKKQDLIQKLQDAIVESLSDELQYMDKARFSLLMDIANNGGVLAPFVGGVSAALYFQNRGLVFAGAVDGQKALVMPQEVIEKLKTVQESDYTDKFNRNTEWIRLSTGLLYYYGVLDTVQLEQMVSGYVSEFVDSEVFMDVLYHAASYYSDILYTEEGWSSWQVDSARELLEGQQSRPSLDYFPFTKEQLLKASEPNYVERTPEYYALFNYIKVNYSVSHEDAHDITAECVENAQAGGLFTETMHFLKSQIEMEDIQTLDEVAGLLVKLFNATRQWELKGRSANEMRALSSNVLSNLPLAKPFPNTSNVVSIDSKKKVGRNDPCHCGSGKKFKKCCSLN